MATVLTVLLLALTCAAAVYLLLLRNLTPATTALRFRAGFAATSLRMLAARPVFGVGIGQYHLLSSEFSSPDIRARYPHENAHNNFLQVLAELGVAGLAAFVSVLGMTVNRIAAVIRAGHGRSPGPGVAAGLLAFVLTWLAGHPLLIDPPAFSFWLLLGAAAGWGAAEAVGHAGLATPPGESAGFSFRSRRSRWGPAALLVALAVSIPVRTRHEVAAANLEHLGIGLSGWHTGSDGIQYRLAGVTATVFVPSEAPVVTLPLRSTVPDGELQVELHLDGRYADAVRVRADDWRNLTIQLPQGRDGPRFRALELRVRDGSRREPPLLMVGKVQPR